MTLQYAIIPVTPYQQNCSVILCTHTGKAAVVDPGGEAERILETLKTMDAVPEKVILTHAHVDHCAASDRLRRQLDIPIEPTGLSGEAMKGEIDRLAQSKDAAEFLSKEQGD